jgi:hypothetical protein
MFPARSWISAAGSTRMEQSGPTRVGSRYAEVDRPLR